MIFGFDIISDLNLTGTDTFNWENKSTSLFCIVVGNVSSDLTLVHKALYHLSKCYQGVFFIDGSLENPDFNLKDFRIKELTKLCSSVQNVVYLHNNVVIVDGIALVGINGWVDTELISDSDRFQARCNRYEDIIYLEKTIERLQLHVDVKRIVIISSSVPAEELYFGEVTSLDDMYPVNVLHSDTEGKVDKWVFGSNSKIVDTYINSINYVSNPKFDRNPYYAKRIEIDI